MIPRQLKKALEKSSKSILLLGPRQTGKSTLISELHPDLSINLAHEPTFVDYLRNPRALEETLAAFPKARTIFIDEVQRLPSLLNTLQVLLDDPANRRRFYLTGSSARKLKRGHANLLPGRIHQYRLGPLTSEELGFKVDLKRALSLGLLPGIWINPDTSDAQKTLRTYASTYIKEEVQAENLVRNLEGFSRFLHIAAEGAGRTLDLAKIASAAQVARQSVVRFFEILEDCLLVHRLDAFGGGLTRRLVQHPRFYFFDTGVLNGLLGSFDVSQDRMGNLFEHLVTTQLIHSAEALDIPIRITTYRTEHGAEVDVILELKNRLIAIEIKSARSITSPETRGFSSFADYYGKAHRAMVLYAGTQRRNVKNIELWPWQEGIREIFKT